VSQFADYSGFRKWYANQSPEDKLDRLMNIKKSPGKILAIGDGYNDALLIGGADIGMVVKGGAQTLTGQADILFSRSDFLLIRDLLTVSKSIPQSIKLCYGISIIYNIGAISLACNGMISPLTAAVLMPLSSVSVCLTAFFRVHRGS
jgi:P-type E1-E2 ATPase